MGASRHLMAWTVVFIGVLLLGGCQGYKVKTRWVNEASINPDDPRATSDLGYGNEAARELSALMR